MRVLLFLLVFLILSSTPALAKNPEVVLTTNRGEIVLELDAQAAPITVENFLTYVREGFYTGTIFHRVIKGFMIQAGGMGEDMERKDGHVAIKNEAANGLKNERYTVAMARTGEVDSATSQFFINTADNAFLDHGSQDFGYAVFGRVIKGQDVVDTIEATPTTSRGMYTDVPATPVIIEQAVVRP